MSLSEQDIPAATVTGVEVRRAIHRRGGNGVDDADAASLPVPVERLGDALGGERGLVGLVTHSAQRGASGDSDNDTSSVSSASDSSPPPSPPRPAETASKHAAAAAVALQQLQPVDDRTPNPYRDKMLRSPHLRLRPPLRGGAPTGLGPGGVPSSNGALVPVSASDGVADDANPTASSTGHRSGMPGAPRTVTGELSTAAVFWTHAVVLGSAEAARERSHAHLSHAEFERQVGLMHQKVVRRLLSAGIRVRMLHDTPLSKGKAVLLLHAPPALLAKEDRRQGVELAILGGRAAAYSSFLATRGNAGMMESTMPSPSPAVINMLMRHLIDNALRDYDVDEWRQGLYAADTHVNVRDVIDAVCPLHDRLWCNDFFGRRANWMQVLCDVTLDNPETDEQLRWHFGERVAFLFAFTKFYTRRLLFLAIVGAVYYFCFRFNPEGWAAYLRGCTVLGLFACAIWSPLTLLSWQRRSAVLEEAWCDTAAPSSTAPASLRMVQPSSTNAPYRPCALADVEQENQGFEYVWKRNMQTGRMEKHAKHHKVWSRVVGGVLMVLVFAVLAVLLVPFLQWYIWARVSSEHGHGWGGGWFYVLAQSVVLGLVLELFHKLFLESARIFVGWENFPREAAFDRALISRSVAFIWPAAFFYYLAVTLIWVPYGREINDALRSLGFMDTITVQGDQFDATWLSLDSTIITPLVVVHMLNLVLENYLPSLWRKWEEGRCCCCPRDPAAAGSDPAADAELRAYLHLTGGQRIGIGETGGFMAGFTCLRLALRILARDVRQCYLGMRGGLSDHDNNTVDGRHGVTDTGADIDAEVGLPHNSRKAGFSGDPECQLDVVALANACGAEITSRSDDSNDLDASAVLLETRRASFNPFDDYLKLALQFSAVTMLFVVWPLIGIMAFATNVLEYHSDVRRLLFICRRPEPRRDRSIGHWGAVLKLESTISCIVVPAVVALYHLGYWNDGDCIQSQMVQDNALIPWFVQRWVNDTTVNSTAFNATVNSTTSGMDGAWLQHVFDCYNSSTYAHLGLFFVLLEHITLLLRLLVSKMASEIPLPVRQRREAALTAGSASLIAATRDVQLSKANARLERKRLDDAEALVAAQAAHESAVNVDARDDSTSSSGVSSKQPTDWMLERAALKILFDECSQRSFLPPPAAPAHLPTAASPSRQSKPHDLKEPSAVPVAVCQTDIAPGWLDERGFASLLCAAFSLPSGQLDWAAPMVFRYADKSASGGLQFDDVALLLQHCDDDHMLSSVLNLRRAQLHNFSGTQARAGAIAMRQARNEMLSSKKRAGVVGAAQLGFSVDATATSRRRFGADNGDNRGQLPGSGDRTFTSARDRGQLQGRGRGRGRGRAIGRGRSQAFSYENSQRQGPRSKSARYGNNAPRTDSARGIDIPRTGGHSKRITTQLQTPTTQRSGQTVAQERPYIRASESAQMQQLEQQQQQPPRPPPQQQQQRRQEQAQPRLPRPRTALEKKAAAMERERTMGVGSDDRRNTGNSSGVGPESAPSGAAASASGGVVFF